MLLILSLLQKEKVAYYKILPPFQINQTKN